MKRFMIASAPTSESVWSFLVTVLGWFIFAFGKSNVGLIVIALIFMLVEMFGCMIAGGLKEEDFGLKEFSQFWMKKSMLLMVPLIGAGVDFAWFLFSDPTQYLGSDVRRYTTKAMTIGVVAYQIREVARLVLTVHKDLPFVKTLMHRLDKMMRQGQDPPQYRREYDIKPKDKEQYYDESRRSS